MFLGEVVLYSIGIPWLMQALDVSLARALELGLAPFVIGDANGRMYPQTDRIRPQLSYGTVVTCTFEVFYTAHEGQGQPSAFQSTKRSDK